MSMSNQSESLRRVLVTGASGALGSAVVNRFVDAGCTVVGADLILESETFQDDSKRKRLHWVKLDATVSESIERTCNQFIDRFGAIDAFVHCAGGFRFAHADSVDDGDIDFLIDANLRSSILMLRETLKSMKQSNFGRIVLVSSAATLRPGPGVSTYSATKSGLNALVKSIAEEVKEFDINVNAILPSVINTEANRSSMPESDFSKWVPPADLARVIFALTQPLMKSVRGALIPVTGGM